MSTIQLEWSIEKLLEANGGELPNPPSIDSSNNPYLREFQKIEKFWYLHRHVRDEAELLLSGSSGNDNARMLQIISNDKKLESRDQLCHQYSWAIPTPDVIAKICEHSPVVELGAGKGYWASLIRKAGGDIIAYEKRIPSSRHSSNRRLNSYCTGRPFIDLKRGDHSKAKKHRDRALFLCWPSYCDPFAYNALREYHGDTVLYVGEGEGGCCGDRHFWKLIREEFEEVDGLSMVNWHGINDYFAVFKRVRKTTGLRKRRAESRPQYAYRMRKSYDEMRAMTDSFKSLMEELELDLSELQC